MLCAMKFRAWPRWRVRTENQVLGSTRPSLPPANLLTSSGFEKEGEKTLTCKDGEEKNVKPLLAPWKNFFHVLHMHLRKEKGEI